MTKRTQCLFICALCAFAALAVLLLLKIWNLEEKAAAFARKDRQDNAAATTTPNQVIVEKRIVTEKIVPGVASASPAVSEDPGAIEANQPHGPTAEEVATDLEVRFQSDALPTVESAHNEAILRKALVDVPSGGVTLENLECKASTCRAQLTFRDVNTDLEFGRRVVLDPKTRPDLNMAVTIPTRTTRADGSIEVTMYYTDEQPGS